VTIPLRPMVEQRRIVSLLDEATQHIAALEAVYAQTAMKYADLASSALGATLKSVSCDRVERLGQICEIEIGRTPPRADSRQWDQDKSTNNVWVSIADMTAVSGGVISSSKERISDLAAASSRVVRAGTLLMSFKLSIGKLAVAGCDLYTNEAIAALCIHANSKVSQRYLYHYLSSVDWAAEARGNEKVKGATLNKAKLKELRIPVPNLEDHIRIATHVDNLKKETQSGMTSARCRLERARDLRQSALEAAFRGEL
jgi:type I restriction enzyme S subunit